jgi:hypothetical protein
MYKSRTTYTDMHPRASAWRAVSRKQQSRCFLTNERAPEQPTHCIASKICHFLHEQESDNCEALVLVLALVLGLILFPLKLVLVP